MKTFQCQCSNRLFFHNTQCVSCGCEVGWCPACGKIAALLAGDASAYRCGNPDCGSPLIKCHNYAVEGVCNRCVADGGAGSASQLCDYCRFNEVIPDLSVDGNRQKWRELESAKRRLFYLLDLLGLPYGRAEDGVQPPLSFDFKSDTGGQGQWSWALDKNERVFTGHSNGKITINIREADPVEREKTRVTFGEPQRTLIGHFRHEIGHYYWQMLVEGRREDDFKQCFGDHLNPTYDEACQRYHQQGPPPDWSNRYISASASMHPWEDFAESFATYLDVASVLDVALNMGLDQGMEPTKAELDDLLDRYIKIGVTINELNRSMGLIDLVPEIFVPATVDRLRFVHDLIQAVAGGCE